MVLIDSMSVLIYIMAWHQTGNQPLLKQKKMMSQVIDTYMHHRASMS